MTAQDTTALDREDLFSLLEAHLAQLGSKYDAALSRRKGMSLLLDWLENAEENTWQARWEVLGEDAKDWRAAAGAESERQRRDLMGALQTLMCHRIIRPSYAWLARQTFLQLPYQLRNTTDREDFNQLLAAAGQTGTNAGTMSFVLSMLTKVLIHTGKRIPQLTTEDLLEYAVNMRAEGRTVNGLHTTHQLLRHMGVVHDPPLTVGFTRRRGQYTVEELVDRHDIECQAIRDVFVSYLKERQPALDYASLTQLAIRLVKLFWRDLEKHHPGIDSLRLPAEVAETWKKRARLLPDGRPRRDLHTLFLAVRCFYLDLGQWAVERPQEWGCYAFPSPITEADLRAFRKVKYHRRAEMHTRIRALMPALPKLVSAVRRRHQAAKGLLEVARKCPEGETFVSEGRRHVRVATRAGGRLRGLGALPVRARPADDPVAKPVNCELEEEDAFWGWAVVEVLRLTGIRLEEMLELTHLSVRRYRMPDEQTVVLLQIAPSKSDQERVLPVCPELAHVLAAIVARIKGSLAHVPTIARYDPHEREMSAPLPYLFQRKRGGQRVLLGKNAVQGLLGRSAAFANLCDVDGEPLRFAPHDFRRMFATDAVNGGLPIHIAAKLLGHFDLDTTRGYVAVYPEEVVRHFQAHMARRRSSRPTEEYREPTEKEWAEFGKHFRRRRMALGDCYRPYGTDCPHEHACIRCPMLRMDPDQLPRLIQIERNTKDLLQEAQENGWEGEATGLQHTLIHIGEKKAQADRILSLRKETTGERSTGA